MGERVWLEELIVHDDELMELDTDQKLGDLYVKLQMAALALQRAEPGYEPLVYVRVGNFDDFFGEPSEG